MNPASSGSNNRKFHIFTKLKDFYTEEEHLNAEGNSSIGTNYIEEKIEPVYESMRLKFKNIYNTEPTFFIRVPYTQILFGDSITHLFEDKIITTLEKDLILCGSKIVEKELNTEFYDKFSERFNHRIGVDLEEAPSSDMKEHNRFVLSAFNYALNNVKPKYSYGANFLLNFNIHSVQSREVLVTTFIASYFASLYIHDGFEIFQDKMIFDLLSNDLLKIENFSNFISQVYFQLFLEKNSIGVYTSTTNEYKQFKINSVSAQNKLDISSSSNFSILVCDTLSPDPPTFYKILNCHTKRRVESKLGMILILKRYKKSLSDEEISGICKTFKNFLKYFEGNLETIYELIDLYVKKAPYKYAELKIEFQTDYNKSTFDLMKYFQDEVNSEFVLQSAKDFELHKRLMFIFREYERVIKISTIMSSLEDKQQNFVSDYFENNILAIITESNSDMNSLYDCLSDEIIRMIDFVNKSAADNTISIKLASDGWSGNIFAVGKEKVIAKLAELVIAYFESYENKGQEIANMWISDEINKYCYWSRFGGSLAVLNPIYEDFMLL